MNLNIKQMKMTGKKIGHFSAQGWEFCDYMDHKSNGDKMKERTRRNYTKKMRNFIKKETRSLIANA